ncbi:Hypothetical predicted protein, partial [Pelobates cultripes]
GRTHAARSTGLLREVATCASRSGRRVLASDREYLRHQKFHLAIRGVQGGSQTASHLKPRAEHLQPASEKGRLVGMR